MMNRDLSLGRDKRGQRQPKITFALCGAGGFAREVMPIAIEALTKRFGSVSACFVDVNPRAAMLNGVPCLSEDEFLESAQPHTLFNVAIADASARRAIAEKWTAAGFIPAGVCAASSEVLSGSLIHDSAILCSNSMVTANAVVGRFFHANIYSYVAHDCVIGDYVTFAPRVCCNGNVVIGDGAYIGTGAVIREGTPESPLVIGEGAVVGMGAVVTRSVDPFSVVVGNPARPMSQSQRLPAP